MSGALFHLRPQRRIFPFPQLSASFRREVIELADEFGLNPRLNCDSIHL